MVTNKNQDPYEIPRKLMVEQQIESRGICDPRVLAAMREIPRHMFVPQNYRHLAYQDSALPIGYQQTISQPYIVAFMSEAAKLNPADKVLEIGTGWGYQAAVLSKLCKEVFTIEIVDALAKEAQEILEELGGYRNIHGRIGDGYKGWPEEAPFDAIIVTAAPEKLPDLLVEQLKLNGRLIIPVGTDQQQLLKVTKTEKGLTEDYLLPVKFVPMTGKAPKL